MLHHVIYAIILITIFLHITPVQAQTVRTGKQAVSEPVETDKRLHSDGQGWKLNQAKRDKTNRPKVLLIGDSILGGYGKQVVTQLKDKAYVDYWVQPYHQGHMEGTYLSNMIKDVLAHGPYDVITFNFGLHGWQSGRIPEGQFITLTRKLVVCLRENAPDARLVWVSTTQITEKDQRPKYWELPTRKTPLGLDPKLNPIIEDHNRMAAQVMDGEKVVMVDFYSLMLPHLAWARGDQFHWQSPAYHLMAQTLTQAIMPMLNVAKEK